MSVINVTNAAELNAAFGAAQAGDTIALAPGSYGDIAVSNRAYAGPVTMRSANDTNRAKLNSFATEAVNNLRLEALHLDNSGNGSGTSSLARFGPVPGSPDQSRACNDCAIVDCELNGLVDGTYSGHYGVYSQYGSGMRTERCFVHDVKNGILNFGSNNVVVLGNVLEDLGEDDMKFAGNNGVLIEDNTGARRKHPVAGAHVDFIQFQSSSSNITVRGNLTLAENTGWAQQGVFLGDGRYTGVLIEDNIIGTGLVGIPIDASFDGVTGPFSDDITIRDNTLILMPGGLENTYPLIRPNTTNWTSTNNIETWKLSQRGPSGASLRVQRTHPSDTFYANTIYANGAKGLGMTIEDLRPVAGSLGETKGAYRRIGELLAGGSGGGSPPPTPPPATVHYLYRSLASSAWTLRSGAAPDTATLPAGGYRVRAVSPVERAFAVTAPPPPVTVLETADARWFFGADNTAMTAVGGGQSLQPVEGAPAHAAGYLTPAVGRHGVRTPFPDANTLSVAVVYRAPATAAIVGTQGDGDTYGWSLALFSGARYLNNRGGYVPTVGSEPGNHPSEWIAEVIALDLPSGTVRRVAGDGEIHEATGVSWTLAAPPTPIGLGVANGGGAAFDGAQADFAALAVWSGESLSLSEAQAVVGELRAALAPRGVAVRVSP